jgi:RNA polymerase sigma-70 factor (ECF subfamily)
MGRKAVHKRASAVRVRRGAHVSDTLLLFAKTRERLARLSDELRLALALVVVDGLSYDEAARRLNIPVASLLGRLALARAALGTMAAEDGRGVAAE